MFERSPAGIANRRLFFGSQLLVYCEGREGSGFPNLDGQFWKILFGTLKPGATVKTEPKGSRTNVLSLFAKAEPNPAVFYAVDSDLDSIADREKTPQLVRTYAYSFENDLFDLDVFIEWIDRLPIGDARRQVQEDFRAAYPVLSALITRLGLLNVRRKLRAGKSFGKEAANGFLDSSTCRLNAGFAAEWKATGRGSFGCYISRRMRAAYFHCCPGETAVRFAFHWLRNRLADGQLYKMPSLVLFVDGLLAVKQRQIEEGKCVRLSYYSTQLS
jgi:hypothetical protein